MSRILIAGKYWTSRALLRAQLIEEGFEVEAYDDVRAGVARLWGSRGMPSLLLIDLLESDGPVEDIATLAHWAKLLPIWIISGRDTAGSGALAGKGFERILFRPLDVGKLVEEIKERLPN
jgi:DNA-binding response OmpR family regulator